ncbi:MAG: prepilin-type N-terminal cleavage/methylation domain-containing protein [Planctomycetota bacterium]
MHANHRHLKPTAHRRGFTLIELLVTISIIAILVGILSPVALRMLGEAEVGRTRAILNALSAALDEYKLVTGEVPDHTLTTGTNAINNLEVSDDDDDDTTIGLLLSRIAQAGGTAESIMRAGIGRQGLAWDRDADGVFSPEEKDPIPFQVAAGDPTDLTRYLDPELWTLEDPWGSKLRYAARVSHGDNFTEDDYLPAHPTPFFASAGPDGEWGDARRLVERENGESLSDDELEDAEQAEDNVYSFQID